MRSKPVVMDEFKTVHTSFGVDFHFDDNITILIGNSATGKSLVFSIMDECKYDDERLVCFNYTDAKCNILEELKKASGKLIVIDNADALLDKETRKYIIFDSKNQYIIIGRDVSNLLATEDNLYEMENSDDGARTILGIKRYCL